jgi:hypothetical protein
MIKKILALTLGALALVWAGDCREPSLQVQARLVEIPGKLPHNDLYNYVYVFKYKVLKVIEGKYAESEILVGQYNPAQARTAIKDKMAPVAKGNLAAFRAGDTHVLKLINSVECVWKDAVEDEYFDDDSQRWYAVETNSAK